MSARPFPSGDQAECGACRRGFVSTAAFDAHRQGFRCLEPSSVGMWLAVDGLWSTYPRDSDAEVARNRARGQALQAKWPREGVIRRAITHEQPAGASQCRDGVSTLPSAVPTGVAS